MARIGIDNIIFEITNECNLNCKYCYNIWKNEKSGISKKEGTYNSTLRTIKKIFKLFNLKIITFTGGEPTLSERFKEIILYCRLQGIETYIITNGNVFEYKEYKELINMGISLFEVTILSNEPAIHDKLTRKQGSWENAKRSVEDIIKLNGNVTGVIVITKENYFDIDKTLELFYDLGVKTVMLNRFNIGGHGIENEFKLALSKQEINIAFTKADIFASKYDIFLSSNVCTPWCYLNPDNYQNVNFVECSNSFFDKPITIDFNGNVRICNHSPVIIGNIYKTKAEDILDNDYIKSWETTIPEFCLNCNILAKCKGGCRGASEQLGLSLFDADPILKYNK